MLLFYIIFGDRNPPYPACNAGGLRRVFFVNRHGGTLRRAGWVAFTKVTDIAFTSDFCNNHSHPASPTSLYLTSPRPRPTRPRVPYLMSSSPSSRVPASHTWCAKSPHTRADVPVPLSPSHFYTQPFFRLLLTLEASEMSAIFCFHDQSNSTSSPDLLG